LLKTVNLDDQNPPAFVPFELNGAEVPEEKQAQIPGEIVNTSAGQIREARDKEEKSRIHIHGLNSAKKGGEYFPDAREVPIPQQKVDTSLIAFKGDPTPKLLNPEIRTEPEYKDLCQMSERQLSNVMDFELENIQYGQVRWDEPVDLRGVNLDEIVRFSQSSFEIYPDMDPKPKSGSGFMKSCSVMLYNVWPKGCNSMDRPSFKREERFRTSLEKHCRSCGYTFITYDSNGVLEFIVENPC